MFLRELIRMDSTAAIQLRHARLSKKRNATAEAIVQLSDALSTLDPLRGAIAEIATNPTEERLNRACYALSALIEVRLLELQMTHESLVAQIAALETVLKTSDGGDLAALGRAIPQPSEHVHDSPRSEHPDSLYS
jgi:hypothetical protein